MLEFLLKLLPVAKKQSEFHKSVCNIDTKQANTLLGSHVGISKIKVFYPDINTFNDKLELCVRIINKEDTDEIKFIQGNVTNISVINFFVNQKGYYVDFEKELDRFKCNVIKFDEAFVAMDANKNASAMYIKYMLGFVHRSVLITVATLEKTFQKQKKWYQL
jgi:hypothetical protein